MDTKVFYSVREAAKVLGISKTWAYQLVNNGQIPALYIGRRRLIPVDVVKKLAKDVLEGWEKQKGTI